MIEKEDIDKFAKEFMERRMEANLSQLQKLMQTNEKSIKKEFLDTFERLCKTCMAKQKEGKKEAVKYIHIFYLRSAMLTQKLEYQMNAYTEMSYMDETECMELWYPTFIMDFYRKDMEELDKESKKNVIRYAYPQLRELRERCFSLYTALVGQYVMQAANELVRLDSYKEMEKDNDIQIIYGGYMDKGIRVWPHVQQYKDTEDK